MFYRLWQVGFTLIIGVACTSPDPVAAKADAIQRGDSLVEAEQYGPAVAAYQTAVAADPKDGLLRMKLARVYERAGRWQEASREAVRAADLLPGNAEAKLLAARLILPQGRFEDAAEFTSELLRDDPDNIPALIVWGNANARLLNSTWALYTLSDAMDSPDEFEPAFRKLRPQAVAKYDQAAEGAFRRALKLAPAMLDAELALANFLWATRRFDEAESLLKGVADRMPGHAIANHALGAFYLSRNRNEEGEKYLKNAALSGAPYNRAPGFALADHYVKVNRDEDALAVLELMTKDEDASGEASLRTAAILVRQGKREEALQRLEGLLARDPKNARALVIKAQILFTAGEVAQALTFSRAAVAADPSSSDARFALGQALDATGDLEDAFNELREAWRLNPDAIQVPAALARLALATGRNGVALEYAREAVRKQPHDQEAAVAVIKALVRLRNYSAADRELKPLLSRYPSSSDLFVQLGTIRAGQGAAPDALAAYLRALDLNPDSLDALSSIVSLDLDQRQVTTARQRVDQALAKRPNDPGYLHLLSRVLAAEGDVRSTESTLRRVLTIDRGNVNAALLLVDCLAAQQRRDEAIRVLEELLERQPSSIVAQTSLATLLEQMGRTAEARARYRRIIEQDPGAATAASRLALLHVNRGDNLDVALGMVSTAKQRSPDDPAVSDALGWVYLNKGHPRLALPHLEDAVRADPRSAVYRYHLGAAYLAAKQSQKAREELTRALQLDPHFPDRTKAQAALDSLQR